MGRLPMFTRAQRIERGLPTCPVDDCPRSPVFSGRCKPHYLSAHIPRRRAGAMSATLVVDIKRELVEGIKRRAEALGTYPARVVEEALEPVVRSWGKT
jgi:hypothetical protein